MHLNDFGAKEKKKQQPGAHLIVREGFGVELEVAQINVIDQAGRDALLVQLLVRGAGHAKHVKLVGDASQGQQDFAAFRRTRTRKKLSKGNERQHVGRGRRHSQDRDAVRGNSAAN